MLRASYAWPIQSHASMGPSCAVADIRDGGGTVWTASQGTHRLRRTIARLLALDAPKLRLIYMDGSGSYGTNGNDDVAFEAALLSRELRRPVRVQWMRRTSTAGIRRGRRNCSTFAPRSTPTATSPRGKPSRWRRRTRRTCRASRCLPLSRRGSTTAPDVSSGLTSLNADPPYTVANMRAEIKWLATTPLRPSNLRAPGKIGNVFAVESFFDELAAAAGVDPLAYRLRQLARPARPGGPAARRRDDGMGAARRTADPQWRGADGRGIAYVHYKQAENYVAMGMEVAVEHSTGAVRVLRVACAHDCGLMINPDAVRAQVEGCILQTLSRTLFEEVTFDRSRVTSTDWASYPILTFPDVPQLDIALIDRRHERPVGAGRPRPRR